MFSGLTNQVTSWIGTSKGENDEKIPTPSEDNNIAVSPDKKEITSPTKPAAGGASKLDMFTNVKTQIEGFGGWLGSSIPKLRKNEDQQQGENQSDEQLISGGNSGGGGGVDTTNTSTDPTKTSPPNKDDDDNSSATGGADSGPQSIAVTPTEDKEGQFGNVQSKALAGAKSFGSFLYSAVNKAGKTVSEASAKIKETVEKNSILGEFNKEQEAFVKGQSNNTTTSLPPWVGCPNEESLKEECLSLSTDRRNFVRSPPAGVDFQFNYETSYPVAMAIMEQDPNLEKMRYELVPKVISEENFWRNYFYRVSLICQANELSSMSGDRQSSTENQSDQPLVNTINKDTEFVSDTLQVSNEDMVEVQEGMKKLVTKNKEEEWERELEAELQDYEVVTEQKTSNKNDNWEQEIEDMLAEDTADLK